MSFTKVGLGGFVSILTQLSMVKGYSNHPVCVCVCVCVCVLHLILKAIRFCYPDELSMNRMGWERQETQRF